MARVRRPATQTIHCRVVVGVGVSRTFLVPITAQMVAAVFAAAQATATVLAGNSVKVACSLKDTIVLQRARVFAATRFLHLRLAAPPARRRAELAPPRSREQRDRPRRR